MAHGCAGSHGCIAARCLEDTGRETNWSEISSAGKQVAELVDGPSKLDKIEFQLHFREAQAENFRKMLMAMAHDLRVVLIKLADRRNNRTMSAVRRRQAQAGLPQKRWEIYAPIANRLGLNKVYRNCRIFPFSSFIRCVPRFWRVPFCSAQATVESC